MTDRRTTYGAFAASILVHLLAILFTWNAELVGEPAMVPDRAPVEELELTLLPDPEAEEPEQPTTYVDIPERLAAENPPERADFLALHDSRAADLVEGGAEDAAPAADLLSKYENVAIRREELGGVSYRCRVEHRRAPVLARDGRADGGTPIAVAGGEAGGRRGAGEIVQTPGLCLHAEHHGGAPAWASR